MCHCGKNSYYLCRSCNDTFCKEHKIAHEKGKQREHIFEKLGRKITIQQVEKIVENLSSKIQVADDCEKQIIDKTERLLAKIQYMCMQALKLIKEKKQHYAILLKHCQQRLLNSQLIDLQSQSKTLVELRMPIYEFKEIKRFYTSPFLSEFDKVDHISSMPVNEAKLFLEQDYGLLLENDPGSVRSVAITSDSKYVVSGFSDWNLRIWNLADNRQEAILSGHKSWVNTAVITKDDKYIISGSSDWTVGVWNFQNYALETVLEGHTDRVFSVAITSDNEYIASGSRDFTVILWNFKDKTQAAVLYAHCQTVSDLKITSDNKYLISASVDNTIVKWNIQDRFQEAILEGHDYDARSIKITSDDKYIIYCEGNNIRIWNIQDNEDEGILQGHSSTVCSIGITSDNNYIISGSGSPIDDTDSTVRIWNLRDKIQEAAMHGHTRLVSAILITSDNKYIVSGSFDSTVRIWNIQAKTQETIIKALTWVVSLSITNDNKYIAFRYRNYAKVTIYNLLDKGEKTIWQGHRDHSVQCIAITSDRQYVVSGASDCTIIIWNLQEKTQRALFSDHKSSVNTLKVIFDNKYIVSGSGSAPETRPMFLDLYFPQDNTVRIWNLEENRVEVVFTGHCYGVNSLAITSDGKYIVSGSYDHTVRIWNLKIIHQKSSL